MFERRDLYDTTHDGKELVNSKRFAFLLYIALTIMLFAALFGGWFVLRGNNDVWPPLGTPPMTLDKIIPTWIALVATIIMMVIARRAMRSNELGRFHFFTKIGIATSVLFLFAFALEWWRLIAGGVRMGTVFGGMYYVITGVFVLHFIGGSYGLTSFLRKAKTTPFVTSRLVGFNNTLSFYYLMLTLWSIIAPLIYIN
ncbi:MAG TPA: cytochrome c oxidase subunit 3 [Candidatus Kapabacteria bacterium]|nr:cytochrome c oxidase subunit 3 [Candidatus Kapabacteria bacterium]